MSSLTGVWVDSVANFGVLSKTINKRHPLNAVIGRRRLILVCYIRTYVIILVGIFPLTSPQPKYWRGCVPGIPGGVDASDRAQCYDDAMFPALFQNCQSGTLMDQAPARQKVQTLTFICTQWRCSTVHSDAATTRLFYVKRISTTKLPQVNKQSVLNISYWYRPLSRRMAPPPPAGITRRASRI